MSDIPGPEAPRDDPLPVDLGHWLRRIDDAASDHIRTRTVLDGVIADARAAGVPIWAIDARSPYDHGLARRIADRVDSERITGHTAPEHLLPRSAEADRVGAPVIIGPLLPGARDREVSIAHDRGPAALRACADQQQFEDFLLHERPELDPADPRQVQWAGSPGRWATDGPAR